MVFDCLGICRKVKLNVYVLNVFIDIQTREELIQMNTNKMMTYGTQCIWYLLCLSVSVYENMIVWALLE